MVSDRLQQGKFSSQIGSDIFGPFLPLKITRENATKLINCFQFIRPETKRRDEDYS